MRILGIDPGLAIVGFAVLESQPKKLVDVGVIRTAAHTPPAQRLAEIYKDMQAIIAEYKPEIAIVEQLFFSKNVTTGIQVSQARGIILLALQEAGVMIEELNPSEMKARLTGDGKADKRAIQKMVQLELGLSTWPKPDDAADALSLALCGAHGVQFRQ